MLRGGVEWTRWSLERASGRFPPVETVFTPVTLPGLSAEDDVHPHPGHRWLRLADLRRLFATRRVLRHHGARLQGHETTCSASGRLTTKRSSTCLSCVRRGSFPSTRSARTTADRNGQQRAVLHAAHARRQLLASRLLEPSLPRREQPPPSGRVAHHGQPVSGFLGVLRRWQGHGTAESDLDFDGLKHDYGFGLRFHGPISTPLRLELAKRQRRARLRGLDLLGLLRHLR